MKPTTLLCTGGAAAMLLLSGCLGPKMNNSGFPTVPPGLLYSEMQNAQMVAPKQLPSQRKFTVLKQVKAEAVTTSFCGLVSIGDASYATLKAKALEECRDADDIIDLEGRLHPQQSARAGEQGHHRNPRRRNQVLISGAAHQTPRRSRRKTKRPPLSRGAFMEPDGPAYPAGTFRRQANAKSLSVDKL